MGFLAGSGPTCYETLAEAATVTCASLQGITDIGVYQCSLVVSTGTNSGTLRHVWRAADGTTTSRDHLHNWRTCTYVAPGTDPFKLTVEDGAEVGALVMGVWAIAWAARALYMTLRDAGDVNE